MPRTAREPSNTGIYHVILRGINQQNIFEDDEDKQKFILILREMKEQCGFSLYAYALMSNHVHLLIKVGEQPLEHIFKRIGGKYVFWFNKKYQRTGHLFQDRFKSEPVEDDEYLLTVICYIHYNPPRGGLCPDLNYKYSSYADYLPGTGDGSLSRQKTTEKPGQRPFGTENRPLSQAITDTDFPLQTFGAEKFFDFHKSPVSTPCLEIATPNFGMTDEAAGRLICRLCGAASVADFQKLPYETQKNTVKTVHAKGASFRQLNRLTGLSKGMLERMCKYGTGDGSLS